MTKLDDNIPNSKMSLPWVLVFLNLRTFLKSNRFEELDWKLPGGSQATKCPPLNFLNYKNASASGGKPPDPL